MPSLSVAALVISHRQPSYLKQTLEGLLDQTSKPIQIMVVETSSDPESLEIARNLGISVITPGDLKLSAAIEAGRAALSETPGWLWILHEDSRPEPQALAEMSKAAEISPSVAIIGPKLLRWEDPIRIQQLGLTVTQIGRPFLMVQDEYDQGQHDTEGDVLAVSTAGMLISNALWQELGGLRDSTPLFAQDIELCLKARAKGYRVVIEPSARVHHAGLSTAGKRSPAWLGGSRLEALAKAHVHLATALWPMPLVILLYVFMPLIVLVNIPLNLLAKRPKRIFSQLSGWLWAWGTLPARLSGRRELRSLGPLKSLSALFAKPAQVRRRRLSELVEVPEPETPLLSGIFASNQAWFALVPLIAAFGLWPAGALFGERLVPLSESFSKVFESVSAELVKRGDGLSLPADPYNWFLALVAAVSPLGPSFGLALFVLVAPALAFFTSWKFVGIFASKPWARTLAALGYSVSPMVLGGAYGGQVVELTALVFAPLAGFLIIKAFIAFNPARSWRWTGLAGLALAMVAVSAPVAALLIAIGVLIASFVYYRRALIVVWSLLPSVALLWPWLTHQIFNSQLELMTSTSWASSAPTSPVEYLPYLAAVAVLTLVGLSISNPKKAILLATIGSLALVASWYQPISSSNPLLGLAVLAGLASFASALDNFPRALRVFASILVMVGIVTQAGAIALLADSKVSFGQERLMPALVVAQANVEGDSVKTLAIDVRGEQVEAELIWGDGLFLEERSLASRYESPELDREGLSKLVASLVAGNPAGVEDLLISSGVRFVLLSSSDINLLSQIEVGVSSMEFLQPAGKSEFGLLWQLAGAVENAQLKVSSPYRDIQLWVLAAFALLALPTPSAIRGSRRALKGER